MDPEKASPPATVYFKGACACGRMTFDCLQIPDKTQSCHCITCRKLSGGPYQTFADTASKKVIFIDHTEHLRYEGLPKDTIGGITFVNFSKAAERAFCATCYTPLAMRYRHNPEEIGLNLGCVEEASVQGEELRKALTPDMHIFTSQKAWWCDVEKDGVPCYDRFRGNYEEGMRVWEKREG